MSSNTQEKSVCEVIDCEGYCSKHNPLRTVSYTRYGAYLGGMWPQCFCNCQPCLDREIEINAEIDAAQAEIDKYEAELIEIKKNQ